MYRFYLFIFVTKKKENVTLNIAIVGCGLIGKKRLDTIGNHALLYAVDPDLKRAESLCIARNQGTPVYDYTEIMKDPALDLVIVATTNDILPRVAILALEHNKHVLIEKPGGRTPQDIENIIAVRKKSSGFVWVGYNHRFHPAVLKAKEIIVSGELGEIMFIRGRYGHGGRLGYEKEWRFSEALSGGGELLDQGVHLIDLSRWFLEDDFTFIDGYANTYFWDTELEDNGFLQLKTKKNQMAWLHVSATEWKNIFCFEIYGKNGKLQIDGLGGSYGTEKLTYYKMLPEMGPPETTSWEYPFPDNSWQREWDCFIKAVAKGTPTDYMLQDALAAMNIVHKIYEQGRETERESIL